MHRPAFVAPGAFAARLSSAPVAKSPLRHSAFSPPSSAARLPAPPAADAAAVAAAAAPRMVSAEVARAGIGVYAVLMAGGGVGAFLKSGSKPSIVSGVLAGVVLAGAYAKESVPLALGTALALAAVFAVRLVKSKKFVPAGLLCVLSVLAALFFAAALYA